jgi:hypothetical protein
MTLGNMRANGVRSISVYCWACHHQAVLAVDGRITFRCGVRPARMVCTSCGTIGADARPNCSERAERPTLTGVQWR